MRVAGLGFNGRATLDDLRAALALAEAACGPADALATAAAKAASPALRALAAERGLPLIAATVAGVATPTQSPLSLAAHGTGSVAEAAALAALSGGALAAPRIAAPSGRATCAIALLSCTDRLAEPRGDGGKAPLPGTAASDPSSQMAAHPE